MPGVPQRGRQRVEDAAASFEPAAGLQTALSSSLPLAEVFGPRTRSKARFEGVGCALHIAACRMRRPS